MLFVFPIRKKKKNRKRILFDFIRFYSFASTAIAHIRISCWVRQIEMKKPSTPNDNSIKCKQVDESLVQKYTDQIV